MAERLVADHFADPPPSSLWNVLNAAVLLAALRDKAGDKDAAVELLDEVLADALARQADLLFDVDRPDDAVARCREVLARFDAAHQPEVAVSVAWAQDMLDHARRRRWRGR